MTNHDELCEKDKEIKELRTRVAELEGKYEKAIDGFNFQLDMRVKSDKKNAELQNHLSTLEMIHKQCLLRDAERLSNLLKASEGMEKALDSLVEHTIVCEEQLDKFHGLGNDSGSGSSVYVLNAQSAIADFRAVNGEK